MGKLALALLFLASCVHAQTLVYDVADPKDPKFVSSLQETLEDLANRINQNKAALANQSFINPGFALLSGNNIFTGNNSFSTSISFTTQGSGIVWADGSVTTTTFHIPQVATNTLTGSGAVNQVAYFNTPTNVTSSASFTFDGISLLYNGYTVATGSGPATQVTFFDPITGHLSSTSSLTMSGNTLTLGQTGTDGASVHFKIGNGPNLFVDSDQIRIQMNSNGDDNFIGWSSAFSKQWRLGMAGGDFEMRDLTGDGAVFRYRGGSGILLNNRGSGVQPESFPTPLAIYGTVTNFGHAAEAPFAGISVAAGRMYFQDDITHYEVSENGRDYRKIALLDSPTPTPNNGAGQVPYIRGGDVAHDNNLLLSSNFIFDGSTLTVPGLAASTVTASLIYLNGTNLSTVITGTGTYQQVAFFDSSGHITSTSSFIFNGTTLAIIGGVISASTFNAIGSAYQLNGTPVIDHNFTFFITNAHFADGTNQITAFSSGTIVSTSAAYYQFNLIAIATTTLSFSTMSLQSQIDADNADETARFNLIGASTQSAAVSIGQLGVSTQSLQSQINSISSTSVAAQLAAIAVSTASLQSQLTNVGSSTNSLQIQTTALGASTATESAARIAGDNALAVSTTSLGITAGQLGISTFTLNQSTISLQSQINANSSSIGQLGMSTAALSASTVSLQNQINNNSASIGQLGISTAALSASTVSLQTQITNVGASTQTLFNNLEAQIVSLGTSTNTIQVNIGASTAALKANIVSLGASTNTIQVNVGASTAALEAQIVSLGASTNTIQVNIGASTAALEAQIVTLGASTNTIQVNVGASTASLQTQITNVGASTAAIEAQIVSIGASTNTIQVNVGASTSALEAQIVSLGTSTNTIQVNVGASTASLQSQLNTKASSGTNNDITDLDALKAIAGPFTVDVGSVTIQIGGFLIVQSSFIVTSGGNVGIGTTTPGVQTLPGRTYLTISGFTRDGILELITQLPDNDGNRVGSIQFTDKNSANADKRIAFISGDLMGSTANDRGGSITFHVKADTGSLQNAVVISSNATTTFEGGFIYISSRTDTPGSFLEIGRSASGASVLSNTNISGLLTFMPGKANPQILMGDATTIGSAFIDASSGRPLFLQSLTTGAVTIGAAGATTVVIAPNSFSIGTSTFVIIGGHIAIGTTTTSAADLSIIQQTNNAGIVLDHYSSDQVGSGYIGRKAEGNIGSPSAVLNGDRIVTFGGIGNDGTSGFPSSSTANMQIIAAENFSSTNHGTLIKFNTTPIGSTTTVNPMQLGPGNSITVSSVAFMGVTYSTQTSAGAGVATTVTCPSGKYAEYGGCDCTGTALVTSVINRPNSTTAGVLPTGHTCQVVGTPGGACAAFVRCSVIQ